MTRVRLYTTAGCHLCEQAASLLAAMVAEGGIEVTVQEIAASATLLARYGDRIPAVSLDGSGAELGWPFDGESLRRFLGRQEPVGLEADLLRRRDSGPYEADFSLHRPTMRLKIGLICPRSPTRLATIAQVRQAPRQFGGGASLTA
jgi:hypothetical protein